MTSLKQIAANRSNASTSTGLRTEERKHRSRRNAVRHGLTAETVIGAIEDAEDYAAFEISHCSRLHRPISGRAGIGATARQHLVAASPRHGHRSRFVQNSG